MARSARRTRRQAQVAGLLVTAGVALACASVQPPPGGPPDKEPPKIVHVVPESGAVVPNFNGDLEIQFDEVIDEQAAGGGGAAMSGLEKQILLSPVRGPVKVSWHRTRVTVRPKEGWKKRVYRLEILPGFTDLRRNRFDSTKTILFTTGPEIGQARLGGIALKWIDQTILQHALIEAVPLPDSAGFMTFADSGGQFELTNLQPGRYVVYATNDENGDRRRGLREAYDSTIVTVDSTANVALFTFPHDTVPPRPRGATPVDSVSVRVEFTQALDPHAKLDSTALTVLELPDSTPVRVAQILSQRVFDSLATMARQKAESASAAARDTLKRAVTVHDTSSRPNILPKVPPGPPPPEAPAQPGTAPKRPPVDTALVRRLLATRPVPSDKFVIRVAKPFKVETRYVVRIYQVTNLIGKKGQGDIGFTTPKPAPPDTTKRTPASTQPPPPSKPPL
jgi:hypothetical protein